MAQRIYIDTSVISALDDARAPDRQSLTREFFDRLREFDAATSELTRAEIERTRDPERRAQMLGVLGLVHVFAISEQAKTLADRYLVAGIFPATVPEDALHVAAAVVAGFDVIVSWNFKHLVNQRRRAAVAALTQSLGYRTPAIISPPEV
jgi:predicted nucleic acid-binding protein